MKIFQITTLWWPEVLRFFFGQQVVTNTNVYNYNNYSVVCSGRNSCNMRYAKAPPLVFRFLPGLLLVVEFVAPEHLSPR